MQRSFKRYSPQAVSNKNNWSVAAIGSNPAQRPKKRYTVLEDPVLACRTLESFCHSRVVSICQDTDIVEIPRKYFCGPKESNFMNLAPFITCA